MHAGNVVFLLTGIWLDWQRLFWCAFVVVLLFSKEISCQNNPNLRGWNAKSARVRVAETNFEMFVFSSVYRYVRQLAIHTSVFFYFKLITQCCMYSTYVSLLLLKLSQHTTCTRMEQKRWRHFSFKYNNQKWSSLLNTLQYSWLRFVSYQMLHCLTGAHTWGCPGISSSIACTEGKGKNRIP